MGGAGGSGAKDRPGDEGAGRRGGQGPGGGGSRGDGGGGLAQDLPVLVVPLRAVAPDIPVPPSEEADRDPSVMERREDHVVFVEEAP